MSKEVNPVKAPVRTRRLRTWWGADPVIRGTTAEARMSSRSIHQHPPHRSTTGNPTVSEQISSCHSPLTVSSANVVASAITNPAQVDPSPNKSEPSTGDKNKSNWRSTASAAAGVFLRGVRDSADTFGPLKSVAGGLCFILENCEVRRFFRVCHLYRLEAFQRTKANTQAIESLAPRVKALSTSLCTSASGGDPREQERRTKLEQ